MTKWMTGANRGVGRGMFDGDTAAGRTDLGTCRGGTGGFLTLDVTETASHQAFAQNQ